AVSSNVEASQETDATRRSPSQPIGLAPPTGELASAVGRLRAPAPRSAQVALRAMHLAQLRAHRLSLTGAEETFRSARRRRFSTPRAQSGGMAAAKVLAITLYPSVVG